jgi:hypothetical protein
MIDQPTPEDLARDAETDIAEHRTLNGIAQYEPREWLAAWIRRAVAAEAERDEAYCVLADIDLMILAEDGTSEANPSLICMARECAEKIPHLRKLFSEYVVTCERLAMDIKALESERDTLRHLLGRAMTLCSSHSARLLDDIDAALNGESPALAD